MLPNQWRRRAIKYPMLIITARNTLQERVQDLDNGDFWLSSLLWLNFSWITHLLPMYSHSEEIVATITSLNQRFRTIQREQLFTSDTAHELCITFGWYPSSLGINGTEWRIVSTKTYPTY